VQGQEVEQIRVFERLLSEVGLGRRQGGRKVADCFALAAVKIGFDLSGEYGTAPAVLERFNGVPKPLFGVLEF
jgi:hypothetical protein